MKKVLILVAHPQLLQSRFNRLLVDAARELPQVTVRDLYELYPTYQIDVASEQAALLIHDVIVFQFPFYWYSSPALLKKWQDDVLTWGFAHGEAGLSLSGKKLICAITTGSPESAYQAGQKHGYSIEEFLRPFEQTARICNMDYGRPFLVQGSARMTDEEMRTVVATYPMRLEVEIQEKD